MTAPGTNHGSNGTGAQERKGISRGDIVMAEDFVREVLTTGPIFMTIDGVGVCITAQKVLPSADLSQTHPEQNV